MTTVQTVAVTDRNANTAPLVTVDEMHNVLLAYAQAYSDENIAELGSLFAPGFLRRNGNGPIEDRNAALATYQQQFDQLTNPNYRLVDLQYRAGRGDDRAAGGYVITSPTGQSRGFIEFAFVVRGGRLLIAGIKVTPT